MKPQFFGPDLILLDKIAAGGMAEVYRARQIGYGGFEKTVAVKRILPNFAQNEEFKSMFRAEANLTGHLQHPNIAQVFANGEFDEYLFLVLEFVDGKNVRQMLARADKKKAKIPIELSVFIVTEAAKGLNYAHDFKDEKTAEHLEIVHRDMSPQNIMLSYDGSVKIVDFGIAKAAARSGNTRAGVLKGKFGYMSPEQAQGMKLDRRTDIFALGIILFELLTQRRLFTADDDLKTLQLVKDCRVPRPSKYNPNVPTNLDTIVLKALSKNAAERYSTANEFYADLVRFLYQSYPNFLPTDLSNFIRNLFAEDISDERTKRDRINAEIPARPASPRRRSSSQPEEEEEDIPTKFGADAPTQVARDSEEVTDTDRTESFNGSADMPKALKASVGELALPSPGMDASRPPQLALDDMPRTPPPARRPSLMGLGGSFPSMSKGDGEERPKLSVVDFEKQRSPISMKAAGAVAVLVLVGLFFVLGPQHKTTTVEGDNPQAVATNPAENPAENPAGQNPVASDPTQVANQNPNQLPVGTVQPGRDPASDPRATAIANPNPSTVTTVANPNPPTEIIPPPAEVKTPPPAEVKTPPVAQSPVPTQVKPVFQPPVAKNPPVIPNQVNTGRGPKIASLQTASNGPNGFLVLNSTPRATEIYINDKLITGADGAVTRTPIEKLSLQPGEYRLVLKNTFFGVTYEGKFKITPDRISPMDVVLK